MLVYFPFDGELNVLEPLDLLPPELGALYELLLGALYELLLGAL